MKPSDVKNVQWIKAADRMPTEAEYAEGLTFAVKWPEGVVDIVSWLNEPYELAMQHLGVFTPPSSAVGYWARTAQIAP